jgi:hypothetical protein
MEVPKVQVLPSDISQGATLRGNEYGWSVSSFPDALASAQAHGYACLGGQFEFRLDDGSTCEMYWLDADSKERAPAESWVNYCNRSCSEVLTKFQHLASVTDFNSQVSSWPSIEIDPTKSLVFVAYFVTEGEYLQLDKGDAR